MPQIFALEHKYVSKDFISFIWQLYGRSTYLGESDWQTLVINGLQTVEQSILDLFYIINYLIRNYHSLFNKLYGNIKILKIRYKMHPTLTNQKLKLHPLILPVIRLSTKSQPSMPESLIRKISQDLGLQINQKILCKLLGHLCDMQLHDFFASIKERKNYRKKQGRGLKKIQVLMELWNKGVDSIQRCSIYPIYQVQDQKARESEDMFLMSQLLRKQSK